MASYTFANRRDVSVRFVIAGVLAVWLASVFLLGAAGAFVAPPGALPLPILIGVTAPLIVVVAAYRSSAVVRGFVLSMDLSLATGIQAWRAGGLVFLAMYAYGLLPGSFAWPAGLGDIAIGVTAPWSRSPWAPARVQVQPRFRGLEPVGNSGSRRGSQYRGAGFAPGFRHRAGGNDSADGTATARADTCLPCAGVHHAASGGARSGTSALRWRPGVLRFAAIA